MYGSCPSFKATQQPVITNTEKKENMTKLLHVYKYYSPWEGDSRKYHPEEWDMLVQ